MGNWKNVSSAIDCSISEDSCNSTTFFGSSNIPKSPHRRSQIWYDVRPSGNFSKISLNFTWHPSHDVSVENLKGYQITIRRTRGKKQEQRTFYYCFHKPLVFEKHVKAQFYYHSCNGLSEISHIVPGDRFKIIISSVPAAWENLTYHITIPNCSDEKFQSVYECVINQLFQAKVKNIHCKNRTVEWEYNIPKDYGNSASLMLCQAEPSYFNECWSQVSFWGNLSLNSTKYYQIPDHFFIPDEAYTLYIWPENLSHILKKTNFSFKGCPAETDPTAFVVAVCVLLTAVIFLIVIIVKRRKKRNQKNVSDAEPIKSNTPCQSLSSLSSPSCSISQSDKKVTVYIVYSNDHPLHQEIVNHFASYLQQDYGSTFDVVFELWQQNIVSTNCTQWMEESIKEADKVIVIWSPGASKRWEDYKAGFPMASTTCATDMFTPVVSQIFSDLFCSRNMGKYYFAYFDYGDKACVPLADFQNQVGQTFILMKDFDELYFRLIDAESHKPGVVVSVEKVSNPDVISYEAQLLDAISRMQNLVKFCEGWYDLPCDEVRDEFIPLLGSSDLGLRSLGDIYLAEKDEGFTENPNLPLHQVEDTTERLRSHIEPLVPLNYSGDAFRQLESLNMMQNNGTELSFISH